MLIHIQMAAGIQSLSALARVVRRGAPLGVLGARSLLTGSASVALPASPSWSLLPASPLWGRLECPTWGSAAPAPLPALDEEGLPATEDGSVPRGRPDSVEAMNRNAREPRKSNHGARPCSSVRRRRKYKTRCNPHPYIPESKQQRKKNMDY